jgi:hypothetical protein
MKQASENLRILSCPKCEAETGFEDSFCQDCGQNLLCEDAAIEYRAPALWESSHAREYESTDSLGYYSTLEPLAQPKKSWFSIDLSPNAAKPVVQLPVIVFVLALLFAAPFGVIAVANSYDSMSEHFICDHARQALAKGNALEAVEDMQRLYMDRSGKLQKESLSLLAQALIARSDTYVQKGSLPSAMKDLRDVPPELPESATAAAKLKDLEVAIGSPTALNNQKPTAVTRKAESPSRNKLSGKQKLGAPQIEKAKTENLKPYEDMATAELAKAELAKAGLNTPELAKSDMAKSDMAKSDMAKAAIAKKDMAKSDMAKAAIAKTDTTTSDVAKAGIARSDIAKSAMTKAEAKQKAHLAASGMASKAPMIVPPPPPLLTADELGTPPTKTTTIADERTKAANSALLAESISHSKDQASHSKDGPNLGKTKGKVAQVQQFEANDVARYNELLAGYFSQEHQIHNGNAVPQEPPTFKEWIGSGKPDFR